MNPTGCREVRMIPSTHLTLLWALKDAVQFDAAWNKFQSRYRETISRWCLRRGLQHADAEDVTETILMRLFRTLQHHNHDPARPFRNWLKTVVENAVRGYYRRLRRRPADRGVGGSSAQQDLVRVVDRKGLDRLVDLIETLTDPALIAAAERARARSPKTFQAFWLVVMDGRPVEDVAAELGMSKGSVYKAKRRGGIILAEEYIG